MIEGAMIGLVVAVVMMLVNRSNAKKGTGLAGTIEAAMRGKGPLPIKQIAALVNLDTFMGRGKVAQALTGLQSVGKLKMTPAPPGTPQLQKIDHITYELI